MDTAKRIPTLDGWRAISIALVIVGHATSYRYALGFQAYFFALLGVKIFFVISGFLITRLALNETAFSAPAFYCRRAFRILPALGVYLLAIAALASPGVIEQSAEGIGRAAIFTCNIPGSDCGWFAGHTWSLGYEEQFYLLFPIAFLLNARVRFFAATHAAIVLFPVATFALPGDWFQVRVFIVPFGCISAGALLACLRLPRSPWMTRAALLCVLLCAAASARLPWDAANVGIGVVLPPAVAWLIHASVTSDGAFRQLLDSRPLAYVGRISFSLYLWQQLFTGPVNLRPDSVWFSLALIPLAAAMSYHFVEVPMIRFGRSVLTGGTRPAAAETSA